ncbi:hypothetical protein MACK_000915 [Theileria orientalis]|uniref:Uncharacterized protein n=1 Tax=Theileria orientalis TaxID=68886 RepID=A0A976MAT4_THEOR|nr:hypothetical protein MACK_000915 [Theileria orientalis]
MFDWIRVDGDTNIDPYVKSHFESTKREIINNTLFFNDIYIKNEVPLCVYYRRCVRLVRSHILMESSVLNQESFKGNNYKLNIDDLPTKNDIYVQIGDKLQSRDSIDTSTTSTCQEPQINHEGIRICASGSCVRKALYLLQDLFTFLSKYYYTDSPSLLPNKSKRSKSNKHKKSVHTDTGEDLKTLDPESANSQNKEALEQELKRLFDVEISTDTIHSVDDTWSFEGTSNDDFENVDLIDDSKLQVSFSIYYNL